MSSYTLSYTVDGSFDDTVAAVEEALADEGFGILSDIDVQATLEEKLGEDFRDYRILGACNPPLAHEAMSAELELGALLPCNVIVYARDDERTGVSAVDPGELLSVVDNSDLDSVATDVRERMTTAMEAVPGAVSVEEPAV
jgi:uncharacterized protein (DUF302 family)